MNAPWFVERIIQELERCGGNLTLADAARLSQCSPDHVRHLFTQLTGTNFRSARLHARIARACELLETDLTITEISSQLQYSDRSEFEKAFKAVYGITPTQYRQRNRSQ